MLINAVILSEGTNDSNLIDNYKYIHALIYLWELIYEFIIWVDLHT